jgi:hypothetical protein
VLVGHQVHIDGPRSLHHGGADPLAEQPGQPGAPGRAQHELGGVDPAGEVQQRGGDVVADHGVEAGAHPLSQRPAAGQRGRMGTGQTVAAQYVRHQQLRADSGGDPAGSPHQRLTFRAAGDRHHQPFPDLPDVGDVVLAAVTAQRHVDLVGQPQQGELAQRGQVRGTEIVGQRGVDLFRAVDVAMRHPAAQRLWGDVDQLDLLGAAHYLIGHGLALRDPGDLLDHVLQRLQVLDIHRGQHRDPGGEQFLDVLPPLGVAGAGGVGVRQLVNHRHRRAARQHRVEVELGDVAGHAPGRHDLQAVEQRLGLWPVVGLDEPHDDVGTALGAPPGLIERGVGLAHPGRGPQVEAQRAP